MSRHEKEGRRHVKRRSRPHTAYDLHVRGPFREAVLVLVPTSGRVRPRQILLSQALPAARVYATTFDEMASKFSYEYREVWMDCGSGRHGVQTLADNVKQLRDVKGWGFPVHVFVTDDDLAHTGMEYSEIERQLGQIGVNNCVFVNGSYPTEESYSPIIKASVVGTKVKRDYRPDQGHYQGR